MSKNELPPLPPVVAHMHSNGDVCAERRPEASLWPVDLVDASELRARDRQIVELCAQICVKYASQRQDDYEGSDYAQGLCDAAEDCAEEIRALLRDSASVSHPQAKDKK